MKTTNNKNKPTDEKSLGSTTCSASICAESQEFLDAVNGPTKGCIFEANPISAKKYMTENAESIAEMESDLRNRMSHLKPYC